MLLELNIRQAVSYCRICWYSSGGRLIKVKKYKVYRVVKNSMRTWTTWISIIKVIFCAKVTLTFTRSNERERKTTSLPLQKRLNNYILHICLSWKLLAKMLHYASRFPKKNIDWFIFLDLKQTHTFIFSCAVICSSGHYFPSVSSFLCCSFPRGLCGWRSDALPAVKPRLNKLHNRRTASLSWVVRFGCSNPVLLLFVFQTQYLDFSSRLYNFYSYHFLV